MIYNLLKFLFRFAINGYFRSISIRNRERIPSLGPVLFVANHTSAFMDPILIASIINRRLFFLARGEAFKNKLASYILIRLNLIPIFRPETTPDEVYKNEAIFKKCYDHLSRGKCILLFPEGFSKTERRLRKMKTGAARIALGAEDQNNFKLGLTIMPIGINYSNPHVFQSDVFINFGKPISVADYKNAFLDNNFQAAINLTEAIKTALERRTIVIKDEALDQLVRNIEKIYRVHLRSSDPKGQPKNEENFFLSKEIVNAVHYFNTKDRPRVEKVGKQIEDYLQEIRYWKLYDTQFREVEAGQKPLYQILLLIIGLPIFLLGFVNNYLPYKVIGFLSKKLSYRADFQGSFQLSLGLLSFLIFYTLQTLVVWKLLGGVLAVAYLVLLFPSGLFALRYAKQYFKLRKRRRLINLFINKTSLIGRLAMERQAIIYELEKGKDEYLKTTSRPVS